MRRPGGAAVPSSAPAGDEGIEYSPDKQAALDYHEEGRPGKIEIVASKPRHEHTRYHSVDELRQHGLQQLRDAVGLLEEKATPSEVDDYRRFVITLANSVATARHKDGHPISDAEGAAIEDISSGLGSDASKARL